MGMAMHRGEKELRQRDMKETAIRGGAQEGNGHALSG
jgi:hypothetical protein